MDRVQNSEPPEPTQHDIGGHQLRAAACVLLFTTNNLTDNLKPAL